ncbi:MAG: prepilin-type N-terminal cleavage/methylation protein [Solirubrobacterales bacterium]|nr:prepilin-type N-terminal cleavage/methylation protein [Solirubrobacterales bacterium]
MSEPRTTAHPSVRPFVCHQNRVGRLVCWMNAHTHLLGWHAGRRYPRAMDRRRLTDDQGFTLVEVLVAALVLVTGMLGVLTCITQAQTTTWSTQARTNANAIVREVVEGVRGVPYEQLVTSTLASSLQTQAGLGDDQLGTPGWQVRRGNFTYTLSVGVCAMDDARDYTGTHEAGQFCASGTTGTAPAVCSQLLSVSGLVGLPGAGASAAAVAGLGDCGLDVDLDGQVDGLVDLAGSVCVGACAAGGVDTSPADAKRVVVLVRWDRGAGSRYVLQATTAANPGLAGAPAITAISSSTSSPVTSASVTSLQVNATSSAQAATVAAYVDGTQQGTAVGSGTAWSFTWSLGSVSAGSAPGSGEVVDGSYLVGLKAYDANGQFGQTRALTVLINRRVPYAPQGLRAGRNGTVAELEWQPSPERDVELYRGYRATAGSWTLVCETTSTRCQDPSPPATGTPDYTVVAVDRDASGTLREGALAATASVPLLNTAPHAPTNLLATSASGTTVLTWTAPALGDPDIGDAIDHYTIYRDGLLYDDRYDRTADATQTTWTDTHVNGQTHTYAITAVDTHLAESAKLGPVTR